MNKPQRITKKALKAFATKLDGDPKVREAVIARLMVAAQKAPLAILHQVAQALEILGEE